MVDEFGNVVEVMPDEDSLPESADDDDVSLARLTTRRLIDLNAACSVKGYGMIQYLFEQDAKRARELGRHVLSGRRGLRPGASPQLE